MSEYWLAVAEVVVWGVAAGCLWLFAVNRWVMNWTDGPLKTATLVGGLVLLIGVAVWVGSTPPSERWKAVPFAILGLVVIGEGRRLALRRGARGEAPVSVSPPARSDWHPKTTTDLAVIRHRVLVPSLRGDRLRVVQLSDLHVTDQVPYEYYLGALETAAQQDPDLLLLTGDFVSTRRRVDLVEELLADRLVARLGVFGVLGNHDFWTDSLAVRRALDRVGVQLLSGRCQRLTLSGGATAQLCGTEHPWGVKLDARAVGEADLTLVLSHNPDNIYELAGLGATAVFGGHYHGGQFRIPGLGAVFVPSRYGRRFDRGRFRIAKTELFVSSGVGVDLPPVRIFCRPDILVVDFVGS
jgi:predicted MPP superfamily phosphohydrolase